MAFCANLNPVKSSARLASRAASKVACAFCLAKDARSARFTASSILLKSPDLRASSPFLSALLTPLRAFADSLLADLNALFSTREALRATSSWSARLPAARPVLVQTVASSMDSAKALRPVAATTPAEAALAPPVTTEPLPTVIHDRGS